MVLATLLAAAGCGGGGGEEPIIRSSTLLDAYRVELRQDADSEPALVLAATVDGLPYAVSVRFSGANGLLGRYERAAGVTSLWQGSELSADTNLATPLIGTFRAEVTQDIGVASSGEFTIGAWFVVSAAGTATVRVAGGPAAGVNLDLDGGPSQFVAWPDFEALFSPGSTAPAWQQAASASYEFMQLALRQAGIAFAALTDAARVSFTNAPDVRRCDAFASSPPPGVLAEGERVLTWLGTANAGFDLQFNDCWMEATDILYRGGVDLAGWRAANDGANRLVFLGFGGDEFGSRVPGGLRYRDLRAAATVATLPGETGLDTEWTLGGGFAIGYTAP